MRERAGHEQCEERWVEDADDISTNSMNEFADARPDMHILIDPLGGRIGALDHASRRTKPGRVAWRAKPGG